MGYEPVCGEHKVEYDSCTSQGKRYVKCTCDPNYYMLTANPSNATAYDIEKCETYDKKMRYRATCKSDYRFTLSTIKREDGEKNSSVCDAGKTPVADGGICTMLYGNNVNKILYKDCDCDSTYIYKKETPGFSYTGACTYKYGDNADETLYTMVTCDTNNHYQSDACKEPLVEDKAYKHSQKDLTCRTCKCPDRYKYASDKLTGNFAVDGTKCGDLYDDYKCQNGWTKDKCFIIRGKPKLCETDTNTTYNVKCSKTCSGYNKNYTGLSSCGDEENACVKVTEDTGTLTCYKKEKAVCPTGYTLGSCPSGKTCDTTTATNDTSKTCYKEKPTCPTGSYMTADECERDNHGTGICKSFVSNGNTCYDNCRRVSKYDRIPEFHKYAAASKIINGDIKCYDKAEVCGDGDIAFSGTSKDGTKIVNLCLTWDNYETKAKNKDIVDLTGELIMEDQGSPGPGEEVFRAVSLYPASFTATKDGKNFTTDGFFHDDEGITLLSLYELDKAIHPRDAILTTTGVHTYKGKFGPEWFGTSYPKAKMSVTGATGTQYGTIGIWDYYGQDYFLHRKLLNSENVIGDDLYMGEDKDITNPGVDIKNTIDVILDTTDEGGLNCDWMSRPYNYTCTVKTLYKNRCLGLNESTKGTATCKRYGYTCPPGTNCYSIDRYMQGLGFVYYEWKKSAYEYYYDCYEGDDNACAYEYYYDCYEGDDNACDYVSDWNGREE